MVFFPEMGMLDPAFGMRVGFLAGGAQLCLLIALSLLDCNCRCGGGLEIGQVF